MSTLTIRNLDPAIKDRLRLRAARNSRSMEAETRAILTEAVVAPAPSPEANLYDRIRARIDFVGGIDLELPPRMPMREPPTFG